MIVLANHIRSLESALHTCFYECVVHQVTIVAGDANKLAYQKQGIQLDGSFGMSTFQFWLDRFEQTIDAYLKKTVPGVCRDFKCQAIFIPHHF